MSKWPSVEGSSLLGMAEPTEHLALLELCVSADLRPRPDQMRELLRLIDVIDFKVVPRPTLSTRPIRLEPVFSPLSVPASLIGPLVGSPSF